MKKFLIITMAALVTLTSCSKFGDMNVDPNRVSTPTTRSLLTSSLIDVGNYNAGATTANFYAQYISEGPYPGASLYQEKNVSFYNWYQGPLYNLQKIIDLNSKDAAEADPATNGSKNNQVAVARILKAYYFWLLTDRWGDIPYTDALKGNSNFLPKYDKQKDIYYDLFKEVKEAMAQIDNGTAIKGDVLLNGNMAAWKRFGATLRMMMALRLSKNDAVKASAEFASAVADGPIGSNSENVVFTFMKDDPTYYHPFYSSFIVRSRNDYAISKPLVDAMKAKSDPRLPVFGEVLNGQVIGLEYGRSTAVNIPGVYSRPGNYNKPDAPVYVFTYAQVLFAKAEAAARGWIPGGMTAAQGFYNDAIKASFQQYGVYSDAAYAAYLLAAPFDATSLDTAIRSIINEKWVAMYMNGYEAWSDWRRTGYPVLTPAPAGVNNGGIPQRQGYPLNEPSLNKTNYDAAVTAQGADDLNTKVWWAK